MYLKEIIEYLEKILKKNEYLQPDKIIPYLGTMFS